MAVDLVVSALDITSYIQIVPFQREKKHIYKWFAKHGWTSYQEEIKK